jgi:hypothetical protein
MRSISHEDWPALPYKDFAPTAHLLHMGLQAIGKLNLLKPFEPEWAHVAFALTSRGLTTGLVPTGSTAFSVDVDLVAHEVVGATTSGRTAGFALGPMSVADLTRRLVEMLRELGIDATVNPMPQEVPHPIPFPEDRERRPYDRALAYAWWSLLVAAHGVLQRYHARFKGKTQPIGLMWGTFDLRDVRYNGEPASPGPGAGYIRRNAMDAAQIEAGFWPGSEAYPRPAFYAFTFPKPPGLEQASVQPGGARWDAALGEFILDYDDLRASRKPEDDLFAFLESTYQAGAERAGWDPGLLGAAAPV